MILDIFSNLLRLKNEGATLGIVTSNNVKHVREVLHFLNFPQNLFDVIVGNQETTKHKPYPDPIYKALEVLNISKDGACYVGDGLDDKKAAINAGVGAVLLDRQNEYENESGIVIHSLSEL